MAVLFVHVGSDPLHHDLVDFLFQPFGISLVSGLPEKPGAWVSPGRAGHNADNTPQGATNGSANCIADLWPAHEGVVFMPWDSCCP